MFWYLNDWWLAYLYFLQTVFHRCAVDTLNIRNQVFAFESHSHVCTFLLLSTRQDTPSKSRGDIYITHTHTHNRETDLSTIYARKKIEHFSLFAEDAEIHTWLWAVHSSQYVIVSAHPFDIVFISSLDKCGWSVAEQQVFPTEVCRGEHTEPRLLLKRNTQTRLNEAVRCTTK